MLTVFLTAAAWFITYYQVRNMGLLMSMGVPMSLGMEGWADATSMTAFTGMWAVMMVAMMLPSTYPTLLLHRIIFIKRRPGERGGTLSFAVAYFLVWTATGMLFFAAYVAIGSLRADYSGTDTLVLRGAGLALLIAGLYQWTSFKSACLKHCRNPLHFVMEHWHDGRLGAARMGVVHGLYCFGCCWGLMTILFVMGVMHLGWMLAIGGIILIEKLTPSSTWIPRIVGIAFVVIGLLVLFWPEILRALSSDVTIGL